MAEGDLATATPTIRVVTPKPKFGIYHIFLIIALCAMITSCVVLYVFIRSFGGFGSVKEKAAAIDRPAAVLVHQGSLLRPIAIC